ncbi:MAG: peptidylprolyl isomerase [Phycisphaerales bacterium]
MSGRGNLDGVASRVLAGLVLAGAAVSGGCAMASRTPRPVVVEMSTSAGLIVMELDEKRAPVGTANFLKYADRGDYAGTVFHRVVPGFVVQGGGQTVDLKELPSDPPIVNEWQNGMRNLRGTVGWARDADPDTATREFYINLVDNEKLDRPRPGTGGAGYAVFGRVVAGMDVVDTIATGETYEIPTREMKNVPRNPVVVTSVRRR